MGDKKIIRVFRRRLERGQAMVEYALILVLVIIGFAIALAATGPAIGNVFSNTVYNLLGQTTTPRQLGGVSDFWATVTWVATQTPQEFPLPTRTLPPPSKTPTPGPSPTNTPVTPTNTPTNTPTPPPTPTPRDFQFTAPWSDSAEDLQYWRLDNSVFLGADGWYGKYYGNRELAGSPDFEGWNKDVLGPDQEFQIDMYWGGGAPQPSWPSGNPGDNWSAIWTRNIYLQQAMTLRFDLRSNNGMRIWILGGSYGNDPNTCSATGVTPGGLGQSRQSGQYPIFYDDSSAYPNDCLLYDKWYHGTADSSVGTRTIPAGLYTLRVDFYEEAGTAQARVIVTQDGLTANPDDSKLDSSWNPTSGQPKCNWSNSDNNSGRDANSAPWMWEEYKDGDPERFTVCHLELRGSVLIPNSMTQPELTFWDIWDLQDDDLQAYVEVAEYVTDASGNLDRSALNWIRVPLHNGSNAATNSRYNYNWTYQVIDLTDVRGDGTTTTDDNFVGKRVTFRFALAALDHNWRRRRWYIDTIRIDNSKRKTFPTGTVWNLDTPDQLDDFILTGSWRLTDKHKRGVSGMSLHESVGDSDNGFPAVWPYTSYNNFSQSPTSDYDLHSLRTHAVEFNGWVDLDASPIDHEGDNQDAILTFWYAYYIDRRTGIEVEYTLDDYSAGDAANWKVVPNGGQIIPRNNGSRLTQTSMQQAEINLEEIVNAEGLTPGNRRFRLRIVMTVRRDASRRDGLWLDDIAIERKSRPKFTRYPFVDDAESGTQNWLMGGTWDRTNLVAFGGNGKATTSSGHSFTDTPGVDGNGVPLQYARNSDSAMEILWPFDLMNDTPENTMSPACNVTPASLCTYDGTAAVDPVLTFWFRRGEIDSGDYFAVEWKRNGDTTWNELWRYEASMATRTNSPSSRTRRNIAWEYVEVDLTPVMNSFDPSPVDPYDDDISFRFRLKANNNWRVGDGVYIDNIILEERNEKDWKLWPTSENRTAAGGASLGNGDGEEFFDDFDFDTNWDSNWILGGQWEVIDWESRNGLFAIHDSVTDMDTGDVQSVSPPDSPVVVPEIDTFNVAEMRTIIDLRGVDVSELPTLYFWYRYYSGDNVRLYVQISYDREGAAPVSPDSLCSGGREQCYEHRYGWSEWFTVWSVSEWKRTYTWQRGQIDLSTYAKTASTPGKRIRIRFVSDALDSGSKRDGLYIDNIRIRYRNNEQVFAIPFFDGARNLANWVPEGIWGLSPELYRGAGGGSTTIGGAIWNYYYWRCDGGGGSIDCRSLAPGGTSWSNRMKAGADVFLSNPAYDGYDNATADDSGAMLDINENWGRNGPVTGWRDRFVARFELTTPVVDGSLLSPGEFLFILSSDDGVRMKYEYAGGKNNPSSPDLSGWNIIDNWNNQSFKPSTGTATFVLGEQYKLTIEYYENGGDAAIQLTMGSNSFSFTDSPKQGPGPSFPEIPSVPRGNSSLILDGLIDLSTAVQPIIEYYTYYETRGCLRFEVSVNGGFTWTQSGLSPSGFNGPTICNSYYMPDQGDWRRRIHSLENYTGGTVMIRFRLDNQNTDSTNRRTQSPYNWLNSWWITDIRIVESCPNRNICGPYAIEVLESGGSTDVTEGGATDTYDLQIVRDPSSGVVQIDITTDGECTVSPTSVSFSAGVTPQTITVTAVDDSDVEASPHACVITHTVNNGATADGNYDNLSQSFNAQVTDNEVGGSVIAEESFNSYAPGSLDGASAGGGWASNWTAIDALAQVVDTSGNPMTYNVSGGGTVNGGNRALEVVGNNNNIVYRQLPLQTGDEVYISFLLRTNSGTTLNNNDFLAVWLDITTSGGHGGAPNIGIKANRGNGSGPEDIFARMSSGNEVYQQAMSNGTTYFVVGRIWKSNPGAGNPYDRFDLWVNPSYSEAGTPQQTSSGGAVLSSFNTLGIRVGNFESGDIAQIDEFKLGTTWADVVP